MSKYQLLREAKALTCQVQDLITRGEDLGGAISVEHFNAMCEATLFPVQGVVSIESYEDPRQQAHANLEGLKDILMGLNRFLFANKPEPKKVVSAKQEQARRKRTEEELKELRQHLKNPDYLKTLSLKFGELKTREEWARRLSVDGKIGENLAEQLRRELEFWTSMVKRTRADCVAYHRWVETGRRLASQCSSQAELEAKLVPHLKKQPSKPGAKLQDPGFDLLGLKSADVLKTAKRGGRYYEFPEVPESTQVTFTYPRKEAFDELIQLQVALAEFYADSWEFEDTDTDWDDIELEREVHALEHGTDLHPESTLDEFGFLEEIEFRVWRLEKALLEMVLETINKERKESE